MLFRSNWPANDPGDAATAITAAVSSAHERVSGMTAYQGPPPVAGFCAVEDCSFLTAAGIPAISYGPGDLRVAHADDEYCLVDEVHLAARTYASLALDWCGAE